MPTLTPTRPRTQPTSPPTYTRRDQARGVGRIVAIGSLVVVFLLAVLLTLGHNGTIGKVYDKARQPESTTTWAHPLQDWVDAHPDAARLLSGN